MYFLLISERLCTAIENGDDQTVINNLLPIGICSFNASRLFLCLVDQTTHNSHLLFVAARRGNLEVIKKLLENPYIDIHSDNPMVCTLQKREAICYFRLLFCRVIFFSFFLSFSFFFYFVVILDINSLDDRV
jgi:hypothetical protein